MPKGSDSQKAANLNASPYGGSSTDGVSLIANIDHTAVGNLLYCSHIILSVQLLIKQITFTQCFYTYLSKA